MISLFRNIPLIKKVIQRYESYQSAYLDAGLYKPGHFYSPIPEWGKLNYEKSISRNLQGINLNIDLQLALVNQFTTIYDDLEFETKKGRNRFYFENNFYSYSDAIITSSIIKTYKPSRIIEVGSGFSSALMCDVNEVFFENSIDIECIEPYPERLNSLLKGNENLSIKQSFLQEISIQEFKKLANNDILFIDSTHVSKFGSDVNYYLFEIFPELASGVLIHIHDIFFPFEYPKDWIINKKIAWNECYILRSFLQNNTDFEIIFWNHYLAEEYKNILFKALPLCEKNTGGSIWLRKK